MKNVELMKMVIFVLHAITIIIEKKSLMNTLLENVDVKKAIMMILKIVNVIHVPFIGIFYYFILFFFFSKSCFYNENT